MNDEDVYRYWQAIRCFKIDIEILSYRNADQTHIRVRFIDKWVHLD